MKNFILLLTTFLSSLFVSGQCHYVVDMQDSYGDGWNGASIDVSVNGTTVANMTCSGSASIDSIATLSGDIVEFSFISGSWDSEITFQITDPSAAALGSFGPNPTVGVFLTNTSNSVCLPTTVNVTFQVDMNQVTNSFTTPEVNGTWNSWCGNCNPMTDNDGDGVWEATIPLLSGNYEYKYSADNWTIQEMNDPNASCTNGNTTYTNRSLSVGTTDMIIPNVCWGSCISCFYSPQAPSGLSCGNGLSGLAFSDDIVLSNGWSGDIGSGNGIWKVNSGGTPSGSTGPTSAFSGSDYLYFETSTGGLDTATAVTPMIDLTGTSNDAELTFWIHAYGAAIGSLNVGVSTSATGPFTNVFNTTGQIQTPSDPWAQIGINLASYVGQQIYVAFTYARDVTGSTSYQGDLAIDLVEVNACVSCIAPFGLSASNITATSADINWTAGGAETEWFLIANGAGTSHTTTAASLSSLSSNTVYTCQVHAICPSGDTSVTSPLFTFTTLCDFALAPTNETFDSGFSQCWAQETNDDFDWTVDAGGTPSGGTGPSDDFTGGGNYLYTEASSPRASGDVATVYSEIIDISGLTNPGLKFLNHMYGSAIGTLTVDLWDASTGTNLGTVFTHSGDRGNQWNEEIIALSSNTNIIQFSITATLGLNTSGQTWPGDIAIDEFGVIEIPSCLSPSNINLTTITAQAVNISWDSTGNETAWNTEIGPTGFSQGSGTISAHSFANTSINNLNPSTSYDFYVQSYCGNGDFSNWYGPYTFQTLATPSCYYTVEMQDSYGDGWNGASIDVSANGNVVANWGFSNGFVALDSIETFNGDVIDFTFNSGSYDSEITFQITAPDGNITTWGPSPPIGVFLTDTSIAPCQPTTVNVTFQVDMNQVTSTFSLPEVNGTWNSWCGNCNPMTDTNGDGIWEATIPLLSGNYEYKYSADTWTIQEMNDPNASCTNGDPVYTNRTLTVGTSDITIPLVCWGSCSPCLYPPQAPQGITCSSGSPGIIFSDDIDNNSLWNGDIGSGNGYWRINSGGTSSGSTGPLSSHSGNEYLYFETSTGGLDTATIVSSPINLSSGSLEAELTFWMHAFGSNIGTLRVGASSNPNGPFTDFYSWTGQYQANQSDPWVQVGVDLAAYIGQTMYLSFTYERANIGVSYQGDLAIDLIEVTTCQSCVDPSGLAINSITNNSAQITWSNDASINTWNTEFGPVGFNLGNGNVSAVSTNSVDFNNLNVNTSYDFYVQAYCGNGNFSSWVGPFTFQTLSDPGCYYKIAMQDSYGDGWNGASIDVSLNGNNIKNFTCSGFNTIDSVLTYSGSIVDFNFNSGSYDSEISFQITNSQGLQIGSFGPSPATGLFLSDTSLSICPSSYAVTLELNSSTIYANSGVIGPNGMYAGGGFLGDAMAAPMIQSTVDTNIWTAVVNVPAGPGPFHYTFLNSPNNGGDWGTKEDLSGLICGDPSNYNDRLLPTITADTTIQHCFGNCSSDGTCVPPVLPTNAVTLTLNTSNITNYGTSIGPNGMYVGGGFLGDALAVPMIQSQANPNLWTATVNVVPGSGPNYYIFLNSPTNGGDWAAKEDLSGLSCGDPNNWNDRLLPNITSDTTIQHCFGSCQSDGSCPCGVVVAPYYESLDIGQLPNCWSQSLISGDGWRFTGSPAYDAANNGRTSGTYAWIDFSGTDQETVLELVQVDISGLAVPELTFDLFSYDGTNGSTPPNILYVEANNGLSWVVIDSLQDNTVAGWDTKTFDLTGYDVSGLVSLRLRGESGGASNDYYNDLLVDNITIGQASNCSQPLYASLNAVNITTTSADLSWIAGGNQSQWNVQYGPSGFFLGYGTTLQNINSTNYSLSGLNSSTSYDYYVQAICSNGDLSYWTGPYSFATLVTCPQPNNLAANNITSNSADLSWTVGGSETSWNIEYGLSGFTQGSGLISNSTSPSHILSGLSSSTFYEYYVQAQCGTNDLSFWTGPFIFNTNCDNEVAPFIDDFNSPTLICWTQNSGDDFDWTLNTGGTGSVATGPSDDVSGGGNYIYIETSSPRQAGDSAIIISSFFDISNLTSAELRFFTHMYGTSINELSIYITDASGLINQIFIKSGDQGDQWNEEIIDLSGYTGLVQFTIIGVAGADSGGTVYRGDIAIDNFEIRANCPPVNTTDIITACESYTWIDGNTYTISNNTATHTLTNATGCDSIVTLDLTINYSNTGTDIITACDSYTWINGNTYIADNNTATHTLTNSYGCDSVVTLNLTINYSKAYTESITACDSYTWTDGVTYTSSNNVAIQNLSTSLGCDSVVTLDLTINNSSSGTDIITACDSYTWIDGNAYTSSNNSATHTLTNAAGCDSIVTLDLTINNSNSGVDVITACDSYTWINGTTYITSNSSATQVLPNVYGCDSLVTLNLTINYSKSSNDSLVVCDTAIWNGNTYNSTGIYVDTLQTIHGCDSVVTMDLTVNYSNTGVDVITACDNYTWIDGTTYTSSNNTATHTLTNIDGCDSVVTMDLTINYSNTGVDVITACDNYTWIDGTSYTSSNNTDTHTLTNIDGCDSVVTLDLTINYSNTGVDVITACDNYTWIDGVTYTSSNNTATHTLTNIDGCDSVVTLDLTINYSNTGVDVITACDNYTWIDGTTYTSSNNSATYTLTNIDGCDSVVTMDLVVNYSIATNDSLVVCDSTIWNGNTYNTTGIYIDTLQTIHGCDSVVTMDLVINYSIATNDSLIVCDSAIWNGSTYNTTGIYVDTLQTIHGCDSVITMDLVVNYSIATNDSLVVCDSAIWNGSTYNTTGIYLDTLQTIHGCDSVITMDLVVNYSIATNDSLVVCDATVWNGNNYDSTGVYVDTLQTMHGCDSVITMDLVVNYSDSSMDTLIACYEYMWNGNTYTNTGTYVDTLQTIHGCDSVATIDLTVIDISVSIDTAQLSLVANIIGGMGPFNYAWSTLDTSATITPTANGQYWLVVVDINGCISDTAFFDVTYLPNVGIVDNGQPMIINIYPNPTLGNITIDLAKQQTEVQVTLYDMYGKLVYLNKYQDSKLIELSFDAPPGIYYLDINSGVRSSRHKIIMQ